MIQIGQTPVILLDSRGLIEPAIERHHSLELMRAFGKSAAVEVPRGSNLLFPNYPDLPAPRINQLVIPTGATRWGYGLFLVNTAMKDAILAEAAANSRKVKVQFYSANNWNLSSSATNFQPVLSLTMSPLPPRPITPTNVSESDDLKNLWLLPMVDQRYWWQNINVEWIEGQSFSTVQGILDYLNNRISVSVSTVNLTCANPKHDQVPDVATGNNFESVAVVLETLAWHIGCQLVPDLASTSVVRGEQQTQFRLISVDDSPTIYGFNMAGRIGLANCTRNADGTVSSDQSGYEVVGSPAVEGGGLISVAAGAAFVPETVLIPQDGGSVSRKASDVGLTLPVATGTTGVLRLKFRNVSSISDSLRDQIAKDFFNRFAKCYDYTFSGVQKWQPTAWDDCLVVSQVRAGNELRCQTRVRTWMQNLMPAPLFSSASASSAVEDTSKKASFCCGDCIDAAQVVGVMISGTEYPSQVTFAGPNLSCCPYSQNVTISVKSGESTYTMPIGDNGLTTPIQCSNGNRLYWILDPVAKTLVASVCVLINGIWTCTNRAKYVPRTPANFDLFCPTVFKLDETFAPRSSTTCSVCVDEICVTPAPPGLSSFCFADSIHNGKLPRAWSVSVVSAWNGPAPYCNQVPANEIQNGPARTLNWGYNWPESECLWTDYVPQFGDTGSTRKVLFLKFCPLTKRWRLFIGGVPQLTEGARNPCPKSSTLITDGYLFEWTDAEFNPIGANSKSWSKTFNCSSPVAQFQATRTVTLQPVV
jgi:hypothetical protein